MELIFKAWN